MKLQKTPAEEKSYDVERERRAQDEQGEHLLRRIREKKEKGDSLLTALTPLYESVILRLQSGSMTIEENIGYLERCIRGTATMLLDFPENVDPEMKERMKLIVDLLSIELQTLYEKKKLQSEEREPADTREEYRGTLKSLIESCHKENPNLTRPELADFIDKHYRALKRNGSAYSREAVLNNIPTNLFNDN